MKKLLITTTAIIGASMIAATAHAEKSVSVGGGYTSVINLGGDDTVNDSMTFGGGTFDLNVNASKTTDSGLVLSASTSLDIVDSNGGTVEANATSAAIAAGFGTIGFSNDGGSAAGVSEAAGLSQSWNAIDDGAIKGAPAGSAGGIGATGHSITYTSPNISGLTLGYTMAASGGNSEVDVSKGEDPSAADHTAYTGFGIKYSMGGAFFNFGSASQTTSHTVKGDDIEANNGENSTGWSGTAMGLGYAAGPLAVRYSTISRSPDKEKMLGEAVEASTDAGIVAANETNETQIGVSFNYGAGTISYVSATEDVRGKDDMTAADATNTILAVSHGLANGLTVGFEMHTADTDSDTTKDGLESASENIITIGLNF